MPASPPMSQRRISIVLPVYNEGENIVECLHRLDAALRGVEHEILVCYDFEEDTTLPAIRAMQDLSPTVKLTRNTIGRGAPNAIRTGFRAASGDVVVTTMADLSDPPEVILPMAEQIRAGKAVVSGSRYMPGGSQSGGPLLKRTLSRVAGRLLHDVAGVGTRDATTNFRAYSAEFLRQVEIESQRGFEIALELTVKAHLLGLGVGEVPSSWTDRSAGKSNFKLWKWLPNYLHWFLLAVAAPLACFGLGLLLYGIGWLQNSTPASRPMLTLLLIALVFVLLLARQLRGRNTWTDLAHPLLWLGPALFVAPRPALLLSAIPSAALLLLARPPSRRPPSGQNRPALVGLLSVVGLGLAGAAMWLSQSVLPIEVANEGLDTGWNAALAQFLAEGRKAGVDWYFTAGPLSPLTAPLYHGELYWWKVLLWEGLWRTASVLFLLRAALRLSGGLERTLLLAGAIIPFLMVDAWAPTFFLSSVLVLGCRERAGPAWEFLGVLMLAALALTKFTFLAGALLTVMALVCLRPGGVGLRIALGFLAALAALWLASGQGLSNIVGYLRTSLEITSAYSQAMSSEVRSPLYLQLGMWAAFGMLVALAMGLLHRGWRGHAAAVMLAGVVFLSFKSGFTRGYDHNSFFFGFALLGALLLPPPEESRRWLAGAARLVRVSTALVAGFGFYASDLRGNGWSDLTSDCSWAAVRIHHNFLRWEHPERQRAELEAQEAARRAQLDLPRMRALVGAATVDLLGYRQGLMTLLPFQWKPRPVFQSYCAMTPGHARANAQHLLSPSGPRYLIACIESIDEHWPASEDGLSLLAMTTHFEALMVEREYMLLARRPEPRAFRRGEPRTLPLEWNQWVDLLPPEGRERLFTLDLEPSLAGRLRAQALSTPPVLAELELSDGSRRQFRLIPGMLREPVLFDPLPSNPEDWMLWMAGAPLPRIQRLRLVVAQEWRGLWHSPVRLRLWETEGLQPQPSPELLEAAGKAVVFIPEPRQILSESGDARIMVEDRPARLVHAPSRIAWELEAGSWSLSAACGMLLPENGPSASDGAEFLVLVRDELDEAPRFLERFSMLPAQQAEDREPRRVELEFELKARGQLLLMTLPGKDKNTVQDWCYWSSVRVRKRR